MAAEASVQTDPYRALYYRWETEQWSAEAIDLSRDPSRWRDLGPASKSALATFVALFRACALAGIEHLVAFAEAAPTEEQHVFLTTQLVDAARHVVFFDRAAREVVGVTEGPPEGVLSEGARSLLSERLPAVARHLRDDPSDETALLDGIVLYHLLVEHALELSLVKFLLGHLSSHAALDGFRAGAAAVGRDLARHVDFATQWLSDSTANGHRAAIEDAVERALPALRTAFDAPPVNRALYDEMPFHAHEAGDWAVGALTKKLHAIGVELRG
ncbi:MAG: hypothetical protein M3290_13795 [Actinomycetota bacterium]|nr:hypothetical protein [Actinomycetota bacterium]